MVRTGGGIGVGVHPSECLAGHGHEGVVADTALPTAGVGGGQAEGVVVTVVAVSGGTALVAARSVEWRAEPPDSRIATGERKGC